MFSLFLISVCSLLCSELTVCQMTSWVQPEFKQQSGKHTTPPQQPYEIRGRKSDISFGGDDCVKSNQDQFLRGGNQKQRCYRHGFLYLVSYFLFYFVVTSLLCLVSTSLSTSCSPVLLALIS